MKIAKLTVKILFSILSILVFPPIGHAQQTYHIKRNNVHGIVPDGYQTHIDPKKLKDKITLFNGYNHVYDVLFSYDQINWDTLKIPNLQFAIFKSKKLFAKIITNKSLSYTKELNNSNVYQLRYDFSQKLWIINLEQTIEK